MKSMTGFGKKHVAVESYQIDIEVKTVNHRFLDIQCRLPRECNSYELAFRQQIKKFVGRGRVECFVNLQKTSEGAKTVTIHWDLLDSLVEQLDQATKTKYQGFHLDIGQVMSGLGSHPDFFEIVETKEQDADLEEVVLQTLEGALLHLNENRQQEGMQIQQVLGNYAQDFTTYVKELNELSTIYEGEYKNKLTTKLTALVGNNLDENRLLTEVAILIEKGDIHEELDRLEIHLKKLKELLLQEQAVGRELDFLIQEMNREVNTIGSKSTTIVIKNAVVQMKTILEKIREQIQNVE